MCQNNWCTCFCTPCSYCILGWYEIKRIKMKNRILMNDGYLCNCENRCICSYILLLCSMVESGSMCSVATFPSCLLLTHVSGSGQQLPHQARSSAKGFRITVPPSYTSKRNVPDLFTYFTLQLFWLKIVQRVSSYTDTPKFKLSTLCLYIQLQ